jgi:predicted NBD/HSP70 family sugar kinase
MYIAIDVGGTKIEVAFYKSKDLGSLITSFTIPTPQSYVTGRENLLSEIAKRHDGDPIEGAGISFPGIVDKEGSILQASNIPDWYRKPLKDDLEGALKANVLMVQDASCSAIAEYMYGDIQNYRKVVHLIMGTGIGGSVIENTGNGVAVSPIEPGGMVVELEARSHGFSKIKGLLEAYVGGGNVEDFYKVKLAAVPDEDKLWDEITDYLAAGINNLNCILKPDVVVIGGGIGFKRRHALASVAEKVKKYDEFVLPPRIEFTKVDGNSSLAGALAANFIRNLVLNT